MPSQEEKDQFKYRLRSLAVLAISFAVLGLFALYRPWTVSDAQFLNRLSPVTQDIGTEELAPDQALLFPLYRSWTDFAGGMERPVRWLSLLCTLFGFGLLFVVLDASPRGSRNFPLAILCLFSLPYFWDEASAIPSSMPGFALGALLLLVLAIPLRLKARPAARILLVLIACAPTLICLLEILPESMSAEASFGDLLNVDRAETLLPSYWPAFLPMSILGLLVLGIIGKRDHAYLDLALFAGAVFGGLGPRFLGEASLPFGAFHGILLAPLVLIIGLKADQVPGRARIPGAMLAGLAILGNFAIFGFQFDWHDDSRAPIVQALDWTAEKISQGAIVIIAGDEVESILFFERHGHRTGQTILRVDNEADALRAAQIVGTERIALVVTIGFYEPLHQQMGLSHEELRDDHQPAKLKLWRLKKRQ